MFRTIIFLVMMPVSCLLAAKERPPLYQIDVIVFTHSQADSFAEELSELSTLPAERSEAIPLKMEMHKDLKPYHLQPASLSQLREEYWALHSKPQYHVLLHYSWLQPYASKRSIALPQINRDGWQLEGILRVQRSNYYLVDSELLFSNTNTKQSPFVFTQRQRLKGGNVYYFDHPQAGMLIKVHQLVI